MIADPGYYELGVPTSVQAFIEVIEGLGEGYMHGKQLLTGIDSLTDFYRQTKQVVWMQECSGADFFRPNYPLKIEIHTSIDK